jgi:dihydrofolate synthase / folylpolyglutamate synthase
MRPACRFEKMGEVIFDVAHNPDAIFHLLQALHTFFPKRQLRFLVGFSSDKDYAFCLRLLSDVATHIHLVQAPQARAASVHALSAAMDAIHAPSYSIHDAMIDGVKEAYASALERGELLIIAGSFYIMADAKEALGMHMTRDSLDLNEKTLAGFLFR